MMVHFEIQKGVSGDTVMISAEELAQLRHDIRSPLNAVLGLSSMLCHDVSGTDRQKEMHATLKTSAEDLQKQINALFGLLKGEQVHPEDREPRVTLSGYAPGPAALVTKGRILLVEDYPPNALVAAAFLRQLGYEVVIAPGGQEALKMFTGDFDAILLDVQMPGVDGLKVAERIRAAEKKGFQPRIPIIGITANATEDDKRFCLRAGMDGYLSKPFTIDQLAETLEKNLN